MDQKDQENFQKKIRAEFLDEAKEIANDFEDILLRLDRDGVHSDPSAIGTLFRLYHTIKGSAFTVGMDKIGHFVHKIENLLSDMRDGHLDFSDEIVEMLLTSNDTLKNHLNLTPHSEDLFEDIFHEIPPPLKKEGDQQTKLSSGLNLFDEDETQNKKEINNSKESKVQSLEKKMLDFLRLGAIRTTVMICDDDEDLRGFLKSIIAPLQFYLILAKDGLDALEKIKKESVDIIFMDIHMPYINGVEFAKKLRSFNRQSSLVMVSGHGESKELAELLNAQVDGFILKPFDKETVLIALYSALKHKILKNSILDLSDVSYQAYMLISKYKSALDRGMQPDEALKKKLDLCMDAIANSVNKLLDM